MKTKIKKIKDVKYAGLVLKLGVLIKQLEQYLTDDEIAKLIAIGLQKDPRKGYTR